MNEKYDICQGAENIPIYLCGEDRHVQFEYVCCNIPGPGYDTIQFEETIQGCGVSGNSCTDSCSNDCCCVQRSHGLAYNNTGQLKQEYFFSNSGAIFECNTSCICESTCRNRVVQHGLKYKLEVFVDKRKGFSLRTLDSILSNTFVCEYAGEILTTAEAKRRFHNQNNSKEMNYVFVLKEHFANDTLVTIVDPKFKGNIGRFLNHSCEPNLKLVPVRVNNMVPKLCLFAARDISAYEELSYDYSSDESNEKEVYTETAVDRKTCYCNAKICKGVLPFDANTL